MLAATLRNDARMSFLLRLRLGMVAVSVKTTKDSRSRLLERKFEHLEEKNKDRGGGERVRSIFSFFSE